jgi:2-polyprenyl-6-methoxyphenol hydroxylase-like FAD-dependent oxidoreductase
VIGDRYQRAKAPLNVGIVGGSIAGCLMALELLGAGHRITVFERSRGELQGLLGAGLGTPTPMFRTLVERGLVDADLPHLALDEMAFVGQEGGGERLGHVALRVPLIFISFHWGDLHRGLRSRVPHDAYRAGQGVSSVSSLDDGAVIRLDDGSEHRFDVVVCAEGYHSQTRTDLFGTEAEYRGYICWRGVLDEREMDTGELMESTFARFGCEGMPGSFLYPVPGADGSIVRGERLVNWGCYVPVAAEELADFLVDSSGQRHDGTIPPGRLRPGQEAEFRTLARESLPPYYADIVNASDGTFAQAVFSVGVPDYHAGRICMTGDAGTVAPPFTGSGIFKAATNAINLTAALGAHEDVDAALAHWGASEAAMAERILDLGRQFDRAFIQGTPDFGTMDTTTAANWWSDSITHPEGFTFEASPADE